MKHCDIKRIKKELEEAQRGDFVTQSAKLRELTQTLGLTGASREGQGQEGIILKMIEKIHIHLQTEIMVNTVKSAKWSCVWAATAATASLGALLLSIFK